MKMAGGMEKSVVAQVTTRKGEAVILLHGLARCSRSMSSLVKPLQKAGYRVYNLDYPSRKLTIEEIAAGFLHPLVCTALERCGTLHFVCHSMGGIVVRAYLKEYSGLSVGRVVTLAPPNHGSELVDFLKNFFLFKKIFGPAGQQLSTDEKSLPKSLGPAHFQLGVIAGNVSCNPLSPWIFGTANDGKVSVASAALPGMQDMLVVSCGHTFIMRRAMVRQQILAFLQSGKFLRQTGDGS